MVRLPTQEILRFPLPDYGRLALVDTHFRARARMKRFAIEDLEGLAEFAPESLVVSSISSVALTERKLHLPSLNIAIVMVSSSLLTERDRDLLWTTFGVPVFGQLLGPDGRVIARECEVHDGLHFERNLTDISRYVVNHATCNCGSETPRLMGLVRERSRAAAA